MNPKICLAVLFLGCAILGASLYEDMPFAPVHGTETQQNYTIESMPPADEGHSAVPNSHNARSVISEGVQVIGSDTVNHDGYTGKGVKVAVIDSGFDINNPEIAGNIAEYKSFDYPNLNIAGDNTRHGTAVAEVIVDIAPDVELYLYNLETATEFLTLVDYILDRGEVDMVSMSLGFLNSLGPTDGTNIIAQKVNEARESGILWINAAGNFAEQHWQGQFTDPDGDGLHNFQPGDESINIDVNGGTPLVLVLSWDDWNLSSQDYELCLLGNFLGEIHLITCSRNNQDGSFPPVEVIEYTSPYATTVHAVIQKYSADRNVNFQLLSLPYDLSQYAVPSSSLGIPADAQGSLSVGASNWNNDVLASYSSQGPTLDGRAKPDITGPTGVTTTAYCGLFSCQIFQGTSASAPHVAGAAALVMEKYPDATADQVQEVLEATVHDRHPKSNQDGTGRVDVSMLAGSDILALDNGNPNCSPCFFPEDMRIAPGDTVTWVNAGNMAIRVAGDSGTEAFDSGNIARGERYSKTFDESGTFAYSDAQHPWASGEIVVTEGQIPLPTSPTMLSAAVTGPNQITVVFSEPVSAVPSDFTDLELIPGGSRTVYSVAGSGTVTLTLAFDGEPVPTNATATMSIAVTDADSNALANLHEVTIEPAEGSGVEGCQYEPDGCYIPSVTTVNVGGKVIFSNTDTVAHTFTAGSPIHGLTGEFDSGLVSAGSSYEYMAEKAGEIPYFCIVHRWMEGVLVVREGMHVSDGQAPILDTVSIASSNAQPGLAGVGDTVTLAFTASEEITNVAVTINGNDYAPTTVGGKTWSATRTIGNTDHEGPVTFTVNFEDLAGNAGSQADSTTDGTGVSVEYATSLRGTVFSDTDGNGMKDAGESGILGYTMYAIDLTNPQVILEAVTGVDGTYTFAVVTPSAAMLVQTTYFPFDHIITTGPFYTYVTPEIGQTVTFDVGFQPVPQSDYVTLDVTAYSDNNANGTRDAGEDTIPDVKVDVYTYTTNELETAVTGTDGTVSKEDLIPANFLAQVVIPEGYTMATSPADPVSGVTGALTVLAPSSGSTIPMEIGLVPALP